MKILHNRIKSEKEAPNRRFPRRVPKKRLEGDLIMTTNSSPALVNVDTVPLPSPGRPPALTHHGCHVRVSCAGALCGCIMRVYRAYIVPACVGVHNACASASAGKNFFSKKQRLHLERLQGDSAFSVNPQKPHRQSTDFI